MINNDKYITNIYFKRTFFIGNSKEFLRVFTPDAPFHLAIALNGYNNRMNLPFQNCLISTENFSAPQVSELLAYHHGMTYILIDLKKLEMGVQKLAEKKVAARYLSGPEQVCLEKISLAKRKREWLGGRFAAKYAAAGLLIQHGNALPPSSLTVIADEHGRPFLAAANKNETLPDISISHSGDLATAMAVSKGLCGIDIQKVTDRVVKVRERFCSPDEEFLLQTYFSAPREKQSSALTKLWAAKEALRKAADLSSLPGFLELELTEIIEGSPHKDTAPWKFVFQWQHLGVNGNQVTEKCFVGVSLIADYALALTVRNDTVD